MFRGKKLKFLIFIGFLKGIDVVWVILPPRFWRLQVRIVFVQFLVSLGALLFLFYCRTQHAQRFDVVQVLLLAQNFSQSRVRHDCVLSIEFTSPF